MSSLAELQYGISRGSVLGSLYSQLCIADYKYRNAAGKNDYFIWFAHQACAYTYFGNFRLKKILARTDKWSAAISTSPASKYTCPGRPGNRFFRPSFNPTYKPVVEMIHINQLELFRNFVFVLDRTLPLNANIRGICQPGFFRLCSSRIAQNVLPPKALERLVHRFVA